MAGGPQNGIRRLADRLIASDPGLIRLWTASSVAITMCCALAVEYGFAQIQPGGQQNVLVAMLLGAVMAMMGSMALVGPDIWPKVRTAVFFPVALGSGMLVGALVGSITDLMLTVFVVIMFVAVFVRRFGPAFFFYGFMLWMGFFFAAFLHATLAMLPWMLADTAVSALLVLLLSITVLRTNPRSALNRAVGAFSARARAVAQVSAELSSVNPGDDRQFDRWQRRLTARQNRLVEAALIIEGWSAQPRALPAGWSAVAVRRHLVNAQLAIEEMANAARALVGSDKRVVAEAARVAALLGHRRYEEADQAARDFLVETTRLMGGQRTDSWWPARHFGSAVRDFVRTVREFNLAGAEGSADPDPEFEPVVTLVMGGNLPGSPAVAGTVAPRGRRWNPLTRLDFTTRQAVQATIAGALAIVLGRAVSPDRYYWAVLAAFVAFTGTATRSETFIKAVNRVLGTLFGLFAAIGLAHLNAGHTWWVLVTIVASVFCGFYLMALSYAYMIFFITIMVGQLYTVLNTFSNGLLVLRLEETAIGAAIGIVVGLVVTPLSTRDTVGSAQRDFLTDLGAFLTTAGERLRGRETSADDLDAAARGVDNRLRQLLLVAAPLTRALLWGNDPRRARHRLTLYSGCAHYARQLTAALRHSPAASGYLADTCVALAAACAGLAEAAEPPGRRQSTPVQQVQAHLMDADAALYLRSVLPGTSAEHPVHRPLKRLWQLLSELVNAGRIPTRTPAPERRGQAAATQDQLPIRGKVTDTAGQPVPTAIVTVVDSAGRQRGKVNTGADGGYQAKTDGAGTYLVVASHPRHETHASHVIVSNAPVELNFVLGPAAKPAVQAEATRTPVHRSAH